MKNENGIITIETGDVITKKSGAVWLNGELYGLENHFDIAFGKGEIKIEGTPTIFDAGAINKDLQQLANQYKLAFPKLVHHLIKTGIDCLNDGNKAFKDELIKNIKS